MAVVGTTNTDMVLGSTLCSDVIMIPGGSAGYQERQGPWIPTWLHVMAQIPGIKMVFDCIRSYKKINTDYGCSSVTDTDTALSSRDQQLHGNDIPISWPYTCSLPQLLSLLHGDLHSF